jgi:hypothetical protein
LPHPNPKCITFTFSLRFAPTPTLIWDHFLSYLPQPPPSYMRSFSLPPTLIYEGGGWGKYERKYNTFMRVRVWGETKMYRECNTFSLSFLSYLPHPPPSYPPPSY